MLLNAQGFGSFAFDQPYLAKGDSANNTLPTIALAYRWVASDLSSSPVVTWTDQIQGIDAAQSTEAYRPTWATNGVSFASASLQYLDVSEACPIDLNNQAQDWILFVGNSTAGAGAHIVLGTDGSVADHYLQAPGALSWYADSTSFPSTLAYPSGTPVELLFWNYACYTNGVLSVTNTSLGNTPHNLIRIGAAGTGGGYFFDGTINEIAVWTNAGNMSASTIAQIHRYVTNTYSFVSP